MKEKSEYIYSIFDIILNTNSTYYEKKLLIDILNKYSKNTKKIFKKVTEELTEQTGVLWELVKEKNKLQIRCNEYNMLFTINRKESEYEKTAHIIQETISYADINNLVTQRNQVSNQELSDTIKQVFQDILTPEITDITSEYQDELQKYIKKQKNTPNEAFKVFIPTQLCYILNNTNENQIISAFIKQKNNPSS